MLACGQRKLSLYIMLNKMLGYYGKCPLNANSLQIEYEHLFLKQNKCFKSVTKIRPKVFTTQLTN